MLDFPGVAASLTAPVGIKMKGFVASRLLSGTKIGLLRIRWLLLILLLRRLWIRRRRRWRLGCGLKPARAAEFRVRQHRSITFRTVHKIFFISRTKNIFFLGVIFNYFDGFFNRLGKLEERNILFADHQIFLPSFNNGLPAFSQ